MSKYTAVIAWQRGNAPFTDKRYSRGHRWRFDGGVEVPASASPVLVPPPLSIEEAVDPEEAFIAALASCHMLFFLSEAARAGFVVDSYRDDAEGVISRDAEGRLAMTEVTLRPAVIFAGERQPADAEHEALHHAAHEKCFIANSVRTEVRCEPRAIAAASRA
jgi:organic hydroperoxide reductase OsmC/OhrA